MNYLNKLLGLSILMSCSAASSAEEKVMVAYCQDGKGCEAYLSDLTYSEADLVLNYLGNLEKAKGNILVFTENNQKQWIHYHSNFDLKKLHQNIFGGQGQPVIRLFPAVLSNDIQPKDGFWSIKSSNPKVTGCPNGVAEQVSKQKFAESGQVKFSQPFKATDMIKHQSIKWLKLAPNQYKAKIFMAGNTQAMFNSVYEIKIVNPNLIKGQAISKINVPTSRNCKIVMDFTYTRKAG